MRIKGKQHREEKLLGLERNKIRENEEIKD